MQTGAKQANLYYVETGGEGLRRTEPNSELPCKTRGPCRRG